MPRENRKRGKKHKKKADEPEGLAQRSTLQVEDQPGDDDLGPSWIVPARESAAVDPNAPFGYVDAEVKAYFRTVDVQIREWQQTKPEEVAEADEDIDPNEDRRMFFLAALTEMSGKEKQLATDPDCSTILERMICSMDDFVRRVFMDKLSGSLEQLCKHRFASHVLQTLLTVAGDTVARETRGIFPPTPDSQEDDGELRTFTQLTLDACEELVPYLVSLIVDPYASHAIRAFLLLLGPDELHAEHGAGDSSSFQIRSKKSAVYKARQGSMKSVFSESQTRNPNGATRHVPNEFQVAASNLVTTLREELNENEVRALVPNQVAGPVVHMLLELEAANGEADMPGSLMDRVLVGLISAVHENSDNKVPESDYVTTLLRDPVASHLLETIVRRSPERVFGVLWGTYFSDQLSRLAVHRVANFVVSRAIERLDAEQLVSAIQELQAVAVKIVRNACSGVLRSLTERAIVLQQGGEDIVELVLAAYGLDSGSSKQVLVPSVLRLVFPSEYQRVMASAQEDKKEEADEGAHHHELRKTDDPFEPKIGGALLLQSLLRLPAPHNEVVLDCIQAMSIDYLTKMAQHPISSRVLDAVLDSPTVPIKAKRKLVMAFLGHYHVLVDDRIGSRVGDRCWASADPYLKEKIARSLIPHEHTLAGSYFGKFFARNLNLHVLQRDPERWKSMQAASKSLAAASASTGTQQSSRPAASTRVDAAVMHDTPSVAGEMKAGRGDKDKGKRKAQPQDEIDALFDATLGKKVKRAELAGGSADKEDEAVEAKPKSKSKDHTSAEKGEKAKKKRDREKSGVDRDLDDVLGAIRSAPRDDKAPKKKKRAH